MKLTRWNVWHTYSSCFMEPITDLHDVAYTLVRSKFASSAFHSAGIAWHYSDGEVVKSLVKIDRVGYESNTKVKLPRVEDPYAMECISQSARMRVAEMSVLNERLQDTLPYVRAHLGECAIYIDGQPTLLYPQIKIYSNGVFLVEFRTTNPPGECSIDKLIDQDINLFTHIGEQIELPPGILSLYTKSRLYKPSWSPITWAKLLIANEENGRRINERQYTHPESKFRFEYVSIGPCCTINDIYDYICGALIAAVDESYRFPLPIKKKRYNIGSYYNPRTSVYLLKYNDQPFNASEINTKFQTELNKVMGRTSSQGNSTNFLGEDLRGFDDFSLYVNKTLTLFVFAKRLKHYTRIHKLSEHTRRAFRDPNSDEVICLHQIKVELTDFADASYHRMLERSTLSVTSVTDILLEKEQLMTLENTLSECSPHGDLNNFFSHTWTILGFEKIRINIEQIFTLKIARLSEIRGLNIQRFGWILSIIFGLSGVVNLAQNFIQPVWRQIGLTLPPGDDLFKIYSTAIAAGSMLLLVLIVWSITARRKPRA